MNLSNVFNWYIFIVKVDSVPFVVGLQHSPICAFHKSLAVVFFIVRYTSVTVIVHNSVACHRYTEFLVYSTCDMYPFYDIIKGNNDLINLVIHWVCRVEHKVEMQEAVFFHKTFLHLHYSCSNFFRHDTHDQYTSIYLPV